MGGVTFRGTPPTGLFCPSVCLPSYPIQNPTQNYSMKLQPISTNFSHPPLANHTTLRCIGRRRIEAPSPIPAHTPPHRGFGGACRRVFRDSTPGWILGGVLVCPTQLKLPNPTHPTQHPTPCYRW